MHGDLDAWLDALSGSDDAFVERVWRLLLRRGPEPSARDTALGKLRDGTLSRSGLVRELVGAAEFEEIAALDAALAFAAGARAAPRVHRGPARPRGLCAPAASDERAVEIPWCLARYDGERSVLDVGYAFAEPAWLAGLLALGAGDLAGVDLAHADVPGIRPLAADVRTLPLPAASVDLVYCVSTLEHIGRDNDVYDVDAPREDDGDLAALRELRRVLRAGGRLLVSVPTGLHDDQGWQVVRTPSAWIDVFERAGFLVYEDELYVRADDGWRTASLFEASAARYGGPGREAGAGAVLLAELHPGSLGGKLRLAVRDVRYADDVRRSTAP